VFITHPGPPALRTYPSGIVLNNNSDFFAACSSLSLIASLIAATTFMV
jgi:hypothetical protein